MHSDRRHDCQIQANKIPMKREHRRWVQFLAVGLLVVLLAIAPVTRIPMAQAAESVIPEALPNRAASPTSNANAFSGSASFMDKLQRLQEDRQLQQLVSEDLEKSLVIREQIQAEVDRAFEHTTALINVLLVVLTMIPLLAAPGIWFVRRSVISQISVETKKQLQEEGRKHLEAEISAEVKKQAEAFQREIDRLTEEFGMQLAELKSLFLDAEQEKDRIVKELSEITPSPMREAANSPEIHQKIQELTKELEILKQNNSQLFFTANDYIEQGKAFYAEARYEDAIAALDKAIQLELDNPRAWFSKGATLAKQQQYEDAAAAYDRATQLNSDLPEAWFGLGSVLTRLQRYREALSAHDKATLLKPDAYQVWFGKARCYALEGDADMAIESLQKAVALNAEKSREAAKADSAFEELRDRDEFQALLTAA